MFNVLFRVTIVLFVIFSELHSQSEPLQILFVGNSHTYANDLPIIFKNIADLNGDTVNTVQSAVGGSRLADHTYRYTTNSLIQSQKWDYVVLQESGNWGSMAYDIAVTAFLPYAYILNEQIKTNNPNTKVVLYMTQGYNWGDYENMQLRVKINYLNAGNLINSNIAPCGLVWQELMKSIDISEFYGGDNYHPSFLGSYISAMTIYTTIFNKNITNLYIPQNIGPDDADLTKKTMNDFVLADTSAWNKELAAMTNFQPIVFKKIPDQLVYENEFFNQRINDLTFLDDDTLSFSACLTTGEPLPNWITFNNEDITFSGVPPQIDSLEIKITATDNYGADISDSFLLNITTADHVGPSNDTTHPTTFMLYPNYPNPFNQNTIIKVNIPKLSDVLINIYNTTGENVKTIHHGELKPGVHKFIWNANSLPSGSYFIKFQSANYTQVVKCLLVK